MEIGIVGSGSMGKGIAQVAATAGHPVKLYDNNPDALTRARTDLERILHRQVEKKRMDRQQAESVLGRIQYVDTIYGCQGAGLVIEAIVESLDAKQNLFEQLEDLVAEDSILATNTSSLSIASIASACKKPGRVLGIHFFNPAPLMKLVEIIPAVQTAPALVVKVESLLQSWNKTTVRAKDTPGFIVNRVARPFYGEALRLLDEGLADTATIDWAMRELGGFRMGPFELMDFIGNDVNFKVTESVYEAFFFDPRYKPSFTQKRLAEAGYLGRKSGQGYYNYRDEAERPEPRRDPNLGTAIFDRILAMLINEAADAVFWNIASPEDVDLAMTKGVNYPKGLLQWANEKGILDCVNAMDALYDEYREDRYRCSPLLRRMARHGQRFFE